jgi:O-antigen/teichoic acid export membrane protein
VNGVAIHSTIDDTAPRRVVNALDHSTNHAAPADSSKRYLAGGFWVLLGRVLGVATTLVSNVVLARLMAPADFGNFLLVVSVIGVGSAVAMFGINHVMVRLLGESLGMADAGRARRALRLGATVAATSIVAVGLAAPFVLYFSLPRANLNGTVLVSISIGIMLIAWQQIAGESLRGLHEQRFANLLSGGQISGPLTAILLIAFVFVFSAIRPLAFSHAMWLMDLSLVITVTFSMYCLWYTTADRLGALTHHQPASSPPLRLLDVMLLGAALMGMQVLAFATTQSDVWIAGMRFGGDGVALYGVARRLAIAVGILPQIAGMAMIAPIATLNSQRRFDEMQQLLQRSATIAAIPAVAACLAFLTLGGPILDGFFGSFYRQSAATLAVMALGQVAVAWGGSCGYVLTMTGNQIVALLVNVVTTVALLVVGSWAGSRFGMLGLAWTSTIVVTFQTIAMWALVRRLVGVWTHGSLASLCPFGRRRNDKLPSFLETTCAEEQL